jgi:hypothetical protein
MYAVEFQAKVKNGTIEIPSQYRDKLKEVVRVIVLAEVEEKTDNLIDQLLETPFRVKGFEPLSRDEIYGRA